MLVARVVLVIREEAKAMERCGEDRVPGRAGVVGVVKR